MRAMNKTNIENQVELFSFGIAAYNNYRYLKEAVDSVLKQDYARIELIISNDGSKDFDEEEITEYINRKKGSNIERVLINNNQTKIRQNFISAGFFCSYQSFLIFSTNA